MRCRGILLLEILGLILLASCTQKMGIEGHSRPLESPDFPRRPPEGTVPQAKKSPAERPAITPALLRKGQEQYRISCVPCHGPSGYGDGMIVKRGFLGPPSYHTDRLRNAPDQHFYDVMTQGYGAMYSYADRVESTDRWAITAYIRALQLSQNANVRELSTDDLNHLSRSDEK